nr:RNA-directed DNA polymerase, eukaryota [Tanacetum cinerariifolium]
ANVVRFERTPSQVPRPSQSVRKATHTGNTFAFVVKGLWVMIELNSPETKNKLMNHVGVASWFKSFHNVQAEFVAKERIVWIDIEGVPLHAWSRATFAKIGSKWGEMMDLEDGFDDLFAQVQGQENNFGNPTVNVEVSSDPF